jgi:hypothetical protein
MMFVRCGFTLSCCTGSRSISIGSKIIFNGTDPMAEIGLELTRRCSPRSFSNEPTLQGLRTKRLTMEYNVNISASILLRWSLMSLPFFQGVVFNLMSTLLSDLFGCVCLCSKRSRRDPTITAAPRDLLCSVLRCLSRRDSATPCL